MFVFSTHRFYSYLRWPSYYFIILSVRSFWRQWLSAISLLPNHKVKLLWLDMMGFRARAYLNIVKTNTIIIWLWNCAIFSEPVICVMELLSYEHVEYNIMKYVTVRLLYERSVRLTFYDVYLSAANYLWNSKLYEYFSPS